MSVDLGRVEKLRTPAEAAALIQSGWTLMVGGFGLSGCPLAVMTWMSGATSISFASASA